MSVEKRNDTPDQIRPVGPPAPANWLSSYVEEDTSTQSMQEYRILPRFKVIQSLSDTTLRDEFKEGGVILTPGNISVAAPKTPFLFAPMFFFTEFIKWNDRRDKSLPAIGERTFDKNSPLAVKCRNSESREEGYGPTDKKGVHAFNARYCEHLNFAGVLYNPETGIAGGIPGTLSFSRGEFMQGKNFVSAIMMRKIGGKQAPLWSQVWQFQSVFREKGGDKKWWGLDFKNPENPYISEQDAPVARALNKELAELFEQQRLGVDRSDEVEEVVSADPATSEM